MPRRDYLNNLCGCCSDISSCCLGSFCPTILARQNLARSRQEVCSCWHCFCASCFTAEFWARTNIRRSHNYYQQPCGDCMILCCCYTLAVCQDARELKVPVEQDAPVIIQTASYGASSPIYAAPPPGYAAPPPAYAPPPPQTPVPPQTPLPPQ